MFKTISLFFAAVCLMGQPAPPAVPAPPCLTPSQTSCTPQLDANGNVTFPGTVSVGNTFLGPATGVTATDTAAIQAALNKTGGAIWLQPGTYSVSNLVPTQNVVIHGYGPQTIISMDGSATGWLIDGSTYGVRLYDVVLDGGLSSTQAATSAAGNRSGIQLNATVRDSGIYNSTVRGFSNIGVGLNGTSSLKFATPALSNVNAYYNYIGIQTRVGASGTAGEYSRIVGCAVTENRIGIYILSGNTHVVGNTFNGSGYNVWIDVDGNSAHGVISGNSINHATLYNLYASNSAAILNGEVITANEVWFGDVLLNNVQGFQVIGNVFGSVTNVILSGNAGETGNPNTLALNTFNTNSNIYAGTPGWSVYDNVGVNGVKLLGAQSVKSSPQYTVGANPELSTNGSFAADTNWTKGTGWTISGSAAHSTSGGGNLSQAMAGVSVGGFYAITYTIANYTTGTWKVGIGGSDQTAVRSGGNGTYTDYFYLRTGTTTFYFSGAWTGDLSALSVKLCAPVNTNAFPTSATGLPTGAVWVDTSSANVLKVVQ